MVITHDNEVIYKGITCKLFKVSKTDLGYIDHEYWELLTMADTPSMNKKCQQAGLESLATGVWKLEIDEETALKILKEQN